MQALKDLAVMGVVIEVWFYSTHRLLHWPPLFKAVHKLHHRFHAPTAVASMFAHPFEYVVGNSLGVVLGPALTNCHPFMGAWWLCFCLVSTGGSHCGYFKKSTREVLRREKRANDGSPPWRAVCVSLPFVMGVVWPLTISARDVVGWVGGADPFAPPTPFRVPLFRVRACLLV
jgi:hypothetical protein